ncbi:MAG TPA: hypothetical protein VFK96_05950 [Gammaproteobacteria bacterium]|nr:hypothetical protein [Gammaproteobacteria bacterium]
MARNSDCRNGRLRAPVFVALLCTLALAAPTTFAAGISPHSALAIARTGAADLALRQVAAGEAAAQDNPADWAQWERVRIEIYQSQGDWQAVVKRVATLPESAPVALRAWALVQAAEAQLALGNGAGARRALQARLTMTNADGQSAWTQVDRLMVRSFILDGRLGQAMSMLKARRRQYPNAPHGRLDRLQARLAILQHDPAQAYALLADTQDDASRPLEWLGGLRAGKLAPAAVIKQTKAFAAGSHAPAARRAALIVGAEAALDDQKPAERIDLLEQAVTMPATAYDRRPPFALKADDIWQALLGLGQTLGHQQGLTDQADLVAAAGKAQPVAAQGLLAAAALNATDAALRVQAQAQLASLLATRPNGHELLRQMYLHSQHFTSPTAVPAPVRYQLAEDALADGQMRLAATLLATLDEPPPDGDATEWQLERARAFILGGKSDAGVAAIDALLASGTTFSFDDLQPSLFALQAIGRDRDAILIFHELLKRRPPPAVRQKLLFWLADSYAAQGKQATAAKLYLQSATALDSASMNRWARTARYNAAGALAKAGLTADARRVYQRLLNASSDPARRAALRQKIATLDTAGD